MKPNLHNPYGYKVCYKEKGCKNYIRRFITRTYREAIRKGVKNVTIMDGRISHSILMELLTDEGAGTMVTGG